MAEVSVILINYNTASLTLQAVASVLKNTEEISYEIIVIDNASEKEDFLYLKSGLLELGKDIKLLKSRINLGFGMGNMMGVQVACGKYYAFLNSDALLIQNSLLKMCDFLNKNSKVSIVGGASEDENKQRYKSFDYRLNLGKEMFGDGLIQFIWPKKYPSRKKAFQKPTPVGSVPGSFFVCRALDFDTVGGFDPNLFLYYEEKDLAYRIEKRLNKEIYSLPEISYIHLKGKSTKSNFSIKQELKISQFYCVRKNLGVFKYLIFYSFNFFKFLIKSPFSKKNRKYFILILRGVSLSDSLRHQQKIKSF